MGNGKKIKNPSPPRDTQSRETNCGMTVELVSGEKVIVKAIPFGDLSNFGKDFGNAIKKVLGDSSAEMEKNLTSNTGIVTSVVAMLPDLVSELANFGANSVGMQQEKFKELQSSDAVRILYGALMVNDIALWVNLFFVAKSQVEMGMSAEKPEWLTS